MSKSQNEGNIFKEYFNRNNTASKAITKYNRHFSEFIRKKEKVESKTIYYLVRKIRLQGLK